MHDYIKAELQPTLESIRNDKNDERRHLLDTTTGMPKCNMTTFVLWQSNVSVRNFRISVPEIHSNLNYFLSTPALKNQLLSIFNPAFRRTSSNKKILYHNELAGTGVGNRFYGDALLIEQSSLIVEKATYSNQEFLLNLQQEMLMLLTQILFFSKQVESNFEICISIFIESNTRVFFHPVNSLVKESVFNTFTLENPFELNVPLTNIQTSTLTDLLQKIMHGFISQEPSLISNEPFLTINRDYTEFEINKLKTILEIKD
jgi:hypothetical protein